MYKILYTFLVILPIWEDSPFALLAGAYGYSLAPAAGLLLGIPLYLVLRKKERSVFTKGWGLLSLYLLIVNSIVIIMWVMSGHPDILRNENIVVKALKGYTFIFSAFCYLLALRQLTIGKSEAFVCKPFAIGFFILLAVSILELPQIPYAFRSLHASGAFPYYRPRLLSMEASWTCMLVVIYAGVSLHYYSKVKKSNIGVGICLCGLAFLVITSRSKALLAISCMAAALFLVRLIRKDIRVLLLVPAVMAILYVSGILTNLLEMISSDLSNYTSFSTRVYSNLVAAKYTLQFPFGTGNAIYIDLYSNMLMENLRIVELFPGGGNPAEILAYANDAVSDVGLSAKSGFFQYAMYWGIPGCICLILMVRKAFDALYRSNLIILGMLLAITAVAVVIFMSPDFEYELFAFLALCDWYYAKHNILNIDAGCNLAVKS